MAIAAHVARSIMNGTRKPSRCGLHADIFLLLVYICKILSLASLCELLQPSHGLKPFFFQPMVWRKRFGQLLLVARLTSFPGPSLVIGREAADSSVSPVVKMKCFSFACGAWECFRVCSMSSSFLVNGASRAPRSVGVCVCVLFLSSSSSSSFFLELRVIRIVAQVVLFLVL